MGRRQILFRISLESVDARRATEKVCLALVFQFRRGVGDDELLAPNGAPGPVADLGFTGLLEFRRGGGQARRRRRGRRIRGTSTRGKLNGTDSNRE